MILEYVSQCAFHYVLVDPIVDHGSKMLTCHPGLFLAEWW